MQPDDKGRHGSVQPNPDAPQRPVDPWTMPGNEPDYLLPVESTNSGWSWSNIWLRRGGVILAGLLVLALIISGISALKNQSNDKSALVTSSGQEDGRLSMGGAMNDQGVIVKEASFETVCPAGFEKKPQAGAFVCEKWEENREEADIVYECPGGYTLRGTGNETDCLKVIGGKIDRKAAGQSFYCASGYKLVGSSCQKVTSVGSKAVYRCASGYKLSGKKCSKKLRAGAVKADCEAGFTKRGSGASTKCEKKTAAKKGTTRYTCPSGQKLVGSGSNSQCQRAEVVKAKETVKCAAGYGPLKSGSTVICVKRAKNATVTGKACADRYVLSNDKELCKRIVDATVTGCPAGYAPNSNNTSCVSVADKKTTATPTQYSCPANFALILTNKCQHIISPTVVYSCPAGWKRVTGSGASTVCQLNATQKPVSILYSCSAGYVLKGSNCQKAVYSKATAITPWVCSDKNYKLSGTTCVYAKAAKLSCSKGSVSGSDCMYTDSKAATKKLECSSSYKLEGSSCVKRQTANRLVSYSCGSGYTRSGDSMCIRQVGGTAQTVDAKSSAPKCRQGYSLSGTECIKRTLVTEPLTEGYVCEDGWVLSEGFDKAQCILDRE